MTNWNKPFPVLFVTIILLLLLAITAQFINNLQQINLISAPQPPRPKVALLLEGPTYDQSWNSSAWVSMNRLKQKYNFRLDIKRNLTAELIEPVTRAYAEQNYQLIIGHGRIFSDAFAKVAPHYANTRFVTINGNPLHANQTAISSDVVKQNYFVGKLAAMMSKSHKVGYIAVNNAAEKRQALSFVNGAAAEHASTIIKQVDTYSDTDSAIAATHALYNEGADVIYTTGDSFNLAVITEAQKLNIYVIGYISNQRFIAPDHVITSVIEDIDKMYDKMFEQYFNGTLPSGKVTYGIESGVNYFSPYGTMVPASVREAIEQEIKQLGDVTR
ncbi:BMP family ABC transporter substrate-binding protein [Brevibacillus fulvus]|uniref:Transcriptional activator of comK gene/basic membrane protein A n=1 Tax=Brevibacillus fulvus TaxID=1125967 RepID=A0A939BPZ9_9BACL|nr:BMP family ABC transporter substrate-binding protein [Brevibacillus fulvus]MBM7591075.1 transcriptional activator of comK gene/basic membrane protein A [Brevibacillus fulvus]